MKNVTSDKRNLWMFPLGTVGRDMIYNLFTNFIFTYILFTRHLTAAQLGAVTAIMVGARVFDALNDPVMGNIIERTRSRYGKFKPWLVIGILSTSVVVYLAFNTSLQGWSFIAFFGVIYFLYSITYTMHDISYWGMVSALSSDPHVRNSLTSRTNLFAGIGGASKEGVLIKGSNYLETLSQVKTVVFDKTGTLTQGVFEVSAVHHTPIEQEKLLEYAALAECASSHPISKSLQRAYGKEIDRSRITDIEEISGHGVIAKVDGVQVAAGNDKLMEQLNIPYQSCHSIGTIIHMALDGKYAGHIVISDIVKPHSKQAIANLKHAGVEKTVMLTGDMKKVADSVAAELGVDEVYSELLPAGKVEKVEGLLAANSGSAKLAFVGDGINDAPVLSRADIGIAMGAMGSDAAIEAADVVLMDDDPLQIAKAIKISRKCIRIVYENIGFALVVKFGCLLLVALGMANMWAAIFADVGVMIIAVLNAIRALRVHNL